MMCENFRQKSVVSVSEEKLVRVQKLLRRAESQLLEFQNSNPDWKPLNGVPLIPKDGAQTRDFFSNIK